MTHISDDRAMWLARYAIPHEPALRAWLLHKRVAGIEIDDVVQETYARLIIAGSVGHVRNPKTYMFQAAHSVVLDQLRRARIVSINAMGNLSQLDIASDVPLADQQLADRDELKRLAEAIAALPSHLRQVFTLRRVEGLSQREVAKHLGIAESTVEKHMAKSFRLLADMFGRGGKRGPHSSSAKRKEVLHIDATGNKSGD